MSMVTSKWMGVVNESGCGHEIFHLHTMGTNSSMQHPPISNPGYAPDWGLSNRINTELV